MTYFRVNRLWRDEQQRNYAEFKDFPTFAAAKDTANLWQVKEGEVWIEQRSNGRQPILTDRKGADEPMTREHLHQLREEIRSFKRKTELKGDA